MAPDLLRVDGVELLCVIGVYPEERSHEQPLRLSLDLPLSAGAAAATGELSRSVDYARLMGQLAFVLQQGAFVLLETAAEAASAVVLAAVDGVAAEVTLTLTKPRALGGNGLPSLTVRRLRGAPVRVARAGTRVDTLWPGPDAAVHRVALASGTALRVPDGAAALVVDAGRQGARRGAGEVISPGPEGAGVVLVVSPPSTTTTALLAALVEA